MHCIPRIRPIESIAAGQEGLHVPRLASCGAIRADELGCAPRQIVSSSVAGLEWVGHHTWTGRLAGFRSVGLEGSEVRRALSPVCRDRWPSQLSFRQSAA